MIYRDTLGSDTVSIHIGRIDISNIMIYRCIAIYQHLLICTHFMTDALWLAVLQLCNYLVLIFFAKSSLHL